jgi:peptidoglycan/xylan/chitin deacetylase (PgdA/CDA1 family)
VLLSFAFAGVTRGAEINPLPAEGCEIAEGAVVRGPTTARRIALVFTGHEYAEGCETILAELARHRAHASFFLTGDFLANARFELLVRRIVADRHYLGPHSDKHLLYCEWNLSKRRLVSRERFDADLSANLAKIARFTSERPAYFLPPYEHHDAEISRWTARLGMQLVNLTPGTRSQADYTEEAAANFVSSLAILDSIVRRARDDPHGLSGYLLLLHVGAGPRRTDKFSARFGEMLNDLAARGYEFVRVDELLDPMRAGVFVRASQIGYRPTDLKIGMGFSDASVPNRFVVVDAGTGAKVLEGEPRPLSGERWGRFDHHAELDIMALQAPGTYVLQVGDARSLPFRIDADAYERLPDQLLEFMRQQRCGYNPWLGTKCHQLDGRTAYGPLPGGTSIDVTGGWHDAGDLLKYHITSGNATAQMLLAYLLEKAVGGGGRVRRFADRFDSRGDDGANGVPDLLDEARWGIEWMLKMHPAPDALYHQVADDRDHIGFRLPQAERADYGWGPGQARIVYFADGKPQGLGPYKSASTGVANLAGRYAAAMALAYQTWKDDPRERAFAERCLKAGREVYDLGKAKEGYQQGNSVRSPYRYEESTWADDMEWGAAELYRTAAEVRYLEDAKRYARLAGSADSWMGRETARHYYYYPFLNVGHFRLHALVDADFQRELAAYYREGIIRCVRAGQSNPYRIGVPFIWCSNNLVVALVTQCGFYERMTGDPSHRAFAARHRDWLFGRNPWGYTMFTSIGRVYPTDVHLQTTKLTGRSVLGGLVDGPIREATFQSLRGVTIKEPDPLAAFQDARAVYHNDFGDYSTNEPTMDGTASAILMLGAEPIPIATPDRESQ